MPLSLGRQHTSAFPCAFEPPAPPSSKQSPRNRMTELWAMATVGRQNSLGTHFLLLCVY